MILILEGADLVGKTEISGLLGRRLNMPVSKIWMDLSNPKPSAMSIAHTLHLVFKAVRPNIIFDRFFLSEYVYGAVLGREYDYVRDLAEMWADIPDVFLVHLTASDEAIRDRYAIRKDWYLDLDKILAVKALYPSVKNILPRSIPFFTIDTSQQLPSECAEIIADWLAEQNISRDTLQG